MKTTEYLDLAKARANLPSDYALAAKIGVTRQALSSWRSESRPRYPDLVYAIQIADLCGIDRMRVITDIELDKADYYGRIAEAAALQRLMDKTVLENIKEYAAKAGSAIITGILAGSILITPDPVNASSISPMKTGEIEGGAHCILCKPTEAKRRRRRERRRSGAMATITRTLYGFSAHH